VPDVALPVARPVGAGGVVATSSCVAEKAMVVTFGLGPRSRVVGLLRSNLSMSGIEYYTRRAVFGTIKVYFISRFRIGFNFLVLFYSYYYGTSRMRCFCNSWRVTNHLVIVLRLNESLKCCERIHTPDCSGPAPTLVPFYSEYSTPRMLLTMLK
jgi:hypothetical protein